MNVSEGLITLLIALGIDKFIGEPPQRFHPVAWMGALIDWGRRLAPRTGAGLRGLHGLVIVVVGGAGVALVGMALERCAVAAFWPLGLLLRAYALKCSFAVRALLRAASDIADALRHHDLPQARHLLGYHLVSRQVDRLRDTEISAATIESVAENTSDSFVAPIFYFLIAGLPGAFVYRYVNTCDAMLGYRTEELEWLGKAAARVDDLLNWIPARLSALLLWLASAISLGRRSEGKEKCCSSGWRIWWRDAGLTESPNAGHPMSMAAGVLGVALEKRDHYRLGSEFPDPTVVEIDKIQSLFRRTVMLVVLLTFTICCVCSTY